MLTELFLVITFVVTGTDNPERVTVIVRSHTILLIPRNTRPCSIAVTVRERTYGHISVIFAILICSPYPTPGA